MFVSDAMAASAPVLESNSVVGTIIQLLLILMIFYFLLIRPQQKRMHEHSEMVNNLKVGDYVLTNGGIYGRVVKLEDIQLSLEVAAGVVIEVDKMSVSNVVEEKKLHENKSNSKKRNKGK